MAEEAFLKGRKVTTPMKEYVSRQLIREWKTLGRFLLDDPGSNVNVEGILDNIEMSNPNHYRECCYLMLTEWQNRMAGEATADRLIKALKDMGQKLLAENLELTILNPCEDNQAPLTPVEQAATPAWSQTNPPRVPCSQEKKRQKIEVKHKKHVYLNIGEAWDELGEELGFSTHRLQIIENEYASLTMRCKTMLREWVRQEDRTVGELEKALLSIYEGKLARELVEL